MKNKLLNTLIGFLILITLLYSKVLSQEFSFEAGNIQNINEKVIKIFQKTDPKNMAGFINIIESL